MPFNRPTLKQIESRVQSDIESRLPGTDPRLRYSVLAILARAFAGAVHGAYGYLDWQSRQYLPDTADDENLQRQASLRKITPAPALPAKGSVTFTGTNGVIVPAGAELQRSDGALYTTDAGATIAAGTATPAVTASLAGAAGNTAASTSLTLTTPIAGANSVATVDGSGLTGGTDADTPAVLRERVVERWQEPPHGGADFDYEAWAKEVAGVTRVWPFALENGPGTVTVRFMTDDLTANGIPGAPKVAEVQNHIDALRPSTAQVTVAAPVAVPLNFTIAVTPDTTAVRAAVEAQLKDLLRREAEPGGTILISHLREAISISDGETDNVLTVPAANVTHAASEIATMGVITWA